MNLEILSSKLTAGIGLGIGRLCSVEAFHASQPIHFVVGIRNRSPIRIGKHGFAAIIVVGIPYHFSRSVDNIGKLAFAVILIFCFAVRIRGRDQFANAVVAVFGLTGIDIH